MWSPSLYLPVTFNSQALVCAAEDSAGDVGNQEPIRSRS